MTAAAVQLRHVPSAPPDPQLWIGAAEAALLLKVDAGSLRRRCRDVLVNSGEAVQHADEAGQLRWFIRRDHDPRLLPGEIGERYQLPDLGGYSLKQIEAALARAKCVEEYGRWRADQSQPERVWMKALLAKLRLETVQPAERKYSCKVKLSERSLRRWSQVYRAPADIEQLIDKRGGDFRSQGDENAWTFFKQLFSHDNKLTKRFCWQQVEIRAKTEGWQWCTYDSCLRQLDKRMPPTVQQAMRDPKAWRNQGEPVATMAPDMHVANGCWIGDDCRCDVLCVIPGREQPVRPWITAWMDDRTRKIVGWHLSLEPDSTTIAAAFQMAVEDPENMGPPKMIRIDNGKSWDSSALQGRTKSQRRARIAEDDLTLWDGMFRRMDIETRWSLPYSPRGKAKLERWFGTMHDRLDRSFLSGYCGSDSTKKPESLKGAVKRKDLPTLAEYEQALASFIAGYNQSAEHSKDDLSEDGVKLSPHDALQRWATRRQPVSLESLRYLMLHWTKPLTAGKRGITTTIKGLRYSWGAGDSLLIPYTRTRGHKVESVRLAYNPKDLSVAWVFTADGKSIGSIRLNDDSSSYGTVKSIEHARSVARMKANHKRSVKLVAQNAMPVRLLSNEQLLAREAAKNPQPRPAAPALQIVRCPLDGEVNAIRQGELKQAASGETDRHRPLPNIPARLRQSINAEDRDGGDDDSGPIDIATIVPAAQPRASWSRLGGLSHDE